MSDEIRSLDGWCFCPERMVATHDGRFIYRFAAPDGWVFTDDPPRTTTFEKAYFSGQNHSGEPYVWEVCPWCGREMLDPPNPFEQSDGWKGEDGG